MAVKRRIKRKIRRRVVKAKIKFALASGTRTRPRVGSKRFKTRAMAVKAGLKMRVRPKFIVKISK